MAPGRRDGAECREGAKGAHKHYHEAATPWGEDPYTHQPYCIPGPFGWLCLGQTAPKTALTHPLAVAGSGNKTSLTVGWALTAGPGLVAA